MKNAFFESFNARLRDECLNDYILGNLAEARDIIETWRIDNNTERLQTSIGGLVPVIVADLCQAIRPASLELRKGSNQRVLTTNLSIERNGIYT